MVGVEEIREEICEEKRGEGGEEIKREEERKGDERKVD